MVKKWAFKKIVIEMRKIRDAIGFKEAESKDIFTNDDRNHFFMGHNASGMTRKEYEALLDRLQAGIEKYYSDLKPVPVIKQIELC